MFKGQITTDVIVQDILFLLAAVNVLLIFGALGFIDSGLSRRKNVISNWVGKLITGLVGGLAFIVVGYAIWSWQFNQALGVHHALSTALSDWWAGGSFLTTFATGIDPNVAPAADVLQIFAGFFLTFAFVLGAFIHSAGLERLRTAPVIVLTAVITGIVFPIICYLTWGSVGPLSVHGLTDFTGIFNIYITVGVISVIVAQQAGPRLGSFDPDPRTTGPRPHDFSQVAVGVFLLLFAIPFVAIGSGYLVPGQGYFGISQTSSGIGLVFINLLAAYIGGGLSGGLLAYRLRDPIWALLGPIAGYIANSALLEISRPWESFLVGAVGLLAAFGTYRLLARLRIDDPKLGPLALGPGIFGAIVTGFVAWGTKTGGYFGITKGKYAFQAATINPFWQLVGVVVTVALVAIPTFIVIGAFRRAGRLRVSEEQEIKGLDLVDWGIENYGEDDRTAVAASNGDNVSLGGADEPHAVPVA